MPEYQFLPEHPDNPYRLGRHQAHHLLLPELDAFRTLPPGPLTDADHERACPPFNQNTCSPQVIEQLGGDPTKVALGNCTMNAAYGCLMTAPFHQAGWQFTEDDCVRGYYEETHLDDSMFPGEWPPQDTGSTGPWSMMVLEKRGLISSWRHTRELHTALRMLMSGPISIGIPWLRSMITPQADGTLVVDEASGVVGGHQIEVLALDVTGQRVQAINSWGPNWGIDAGRAWLSWEDFDLLLHLGGEAVQPVMEASA